MNYYQTVVNAITERIEQGSSYLSFFKREAQISKRDNFVEFSDFFNGCSNVVESYHKDLKRQFDERIEDQNHSIRLIKFGRADDHILSNTYSEAEKEEILKDFETQKQHIIDLGLSDYVCMISESGEITDHTSYKYSINQQAMLELLFDIIQAEKELTNPILIPQVQMPANTPSQLLGKIPERIVCALYSAMCKKKLIEPDEESFLFWFGVSSNAPANLKRLVWTGKSSSLLALFVEVANDKLDLMHGERRLIAPFEMMFGVSNISGSISDYKKRGIVPLDSKIIYKLFDSILK